MSYFAKQKMSEILHIRWQFFFYWWNREKVISRAKETFFWPFSAISGHFQKKTGCFGSGSHFFAISSKKNCHLICKISNIFCLANYDLWWSWFFDFYLWVSKFLNLQNCIKTCFNYFFLFLSSFLALVETFLGVSKSS